MVKKNLSSLGRQSCTCQTEKDSWEKIGLQRVRDRHYYERRQEHNEWGQLERGPRIPTTDSDTEITYENFPDANMVCPSCEKEYIVVCDIKARDEIEARDDTLDGIADGMQENGYTGYVSDDGESVIILEPELGSDMVMWLSNANASIESQEVGFKVSIE